MNTKKDEPGKDPSGAAGVRPHATLDLKATVVPPPSSKDDKGSGPEQQGKAGAAGALPGANPRGEAGAARSEAPKPGAPKADAPKPGASNAPAGGAPPKGSGHGGFFTHLAAGVAGGIFALLAADMLASGLGLSERGEPSDTAALQERIATLEAASAQKGGTSQLASRLSAAEAKLGKLAQIGGTVDRLAQKQDELGRELKAVDAKVGAQGEGGSADARIAKLEEQLSALSATAERDPQSGRLPQLAAVTGKIADLELTMRNQLDALRKGVNDEIDSRLSVASEASEAAKSGTQRIDRDLAGVKTESAQLAAGLNTLKAESERTDTTLKATEETLSRLKAEIDARLGTFAKPEDVAAAVTPLSGKLSALQADVKGVVESEASRKATAERIVLSLELGSLKRAIDRGKGFAPELAQARKLSDGTIDLAPLERFSETGVPTLAGLRQDFKDVAFKLIDAGEEPAQGSIVDRLLAGAKSVVRVRKINHSADDTSVEAVVERMEEALNEDRLGDVLQEAKLLPQPAQAAAQDFLAKVEARYAVDRALASVEMQLKASLVAPAGPAGAAKELGGRHAALDRLSHRSRDSLPPGSPGSPTAPESSSSNGRAIRSKRASSAPSSCWSRSSSPCCWRGRFCATYGTGRRPSAA